MKNDPFVPLLLLVIVLAWLFPSLGVAREGFDPAAIAGWGVTVVFLFYGLKLNPSALRSDLSNVRLHTVIQLATFVIFPLLTLPFMLIQSELSALWLGVFFVAALPSTVSSSVVMTSLAGGNVTSAIFNASFSSLAGIALTPLWMSLFLTSNSGGAPFLDVLIDLSLQVLAPIIVGMLLHKRFGAWASAHKTTLRWFDQTVILAIVWTAFCDSFAQEMFADISTMEVVILCVGMMALFFAVYFIIFGVSKKLKFTRQDTITALFCGSKKSLVHGTVMSSVLISNTAMLGPFLLPIMAYHALQLVIVGYLATYFKQGRIIKTQESEISQ